MSKANRWWRDYDAEVREWGRLRDEASGTTTIVSADGKSIISYGRRIVVECNEWGQPVWARRL